MILQKEETVFEPIEAGTRFCFRCHPDIGCFNLCCSKLKLTLTPYDILRVKDALNMDSDSFLDRYTEVYFDRGRPFPLVQLRMLDDERRSCPFVTSSGCSIYPNRPGACRLYPMGRATAHHRAGTMEIAESFFLVREKHCLGRAEDFLWTPEEWMSHEGLDTYLAFNDPWQRIVTAAAVPGGSGDMEKKKSMFFMASYNLDRFRSFLFASSFFKRFHVDPALRETIREDDEDLLRFAFDWLKFSLLGENTLRPI